MARRAKKGAKAASKRADDWNETWPPSEKVAAGEGDGEVEAAAAVSWARSGRGGIITFGMMRPAAAAARRAIEPGRRVGFPMGLISRPSIST
jgi:hypothetical protein